MTIANDGEIGINDRLLVQFGKSLSGNSTTFEFHDRPVEEVTIVEISPSGNYVRTKQNDHWYHVHGIRVVERLPSNEGSIEIKKAGYEVTCYACVDAGYVSRDCPECHGSGKDHIRHTPTRKEPK